MFPTGISRSAEAGNRLRGADAFPKDWIKVYHNDAEVDACLDHLPDAGFHVLNQIRLNQVVVDFGGAERNAAVLARIQDDGTCWCGPTSWHGRSAMRISVSCWATSTEDVEASIAAMLRSAAAA